MNFKDSFPLIFFINLGRRGDRRAATEEKLLHAGIKAERFPAIDARRYAGKWKDGEEVRGYANAGRYALALTQRLAIREAKRRKAPAVLLLEDDVVLSPSFQSLAEITELPDDWGVFYLGCAHSRAPEWAGSRVVRIRHAVDTHAVAIKAEFYDAVLDVLDRHGKADHGIAKASDQFLTSIVHRVPSYACFPNLAWQKVDESDLTQTCYSNYYDDGGQKHWRDAVDHLLSDLVSEDETPLKLDRELRRNGEKGAKLALLFLTRDDVNHPDIWQDFINEAPESVRVFSHRKQWPPSGKDILVDEISPLSKESDDPGTEGSRAFLDGTEISEWYATRWGDISLVRATRALLLEALADESITHFALLSENCVPAMPLPEILRKLEIDPRSRFRSRTYHLTSERNRSRIGAVPEVPLDCWRFQSQWWLMNRSAACFSAVQDYTDMFEKMFAPDESYFATVLAMQGYPVESDVVDNVSTWTWWEKDAGHPNSWPMIPNEKLRRIVNSGAMFARKFPKGADIARYGLHLSPRRRPLATEAIQALQSA